MKTVIAAVIACAALVAAPHQRTAPEPVACTFAHPHYPGNCVEKVTPAGKQTPVQACRVILDCLNHPQCVKTYCQSTTIRGGWTLVSPKEKQTKSTQGDTCE